MKTKLPLRSNFLGHVLNFKNSFCLLIVLFFAMSSFGQSLDEKIIFSICGDNNVTFTGSPDDVNNGYPKWSNGTFDIDDSSGWTLEVQKTIEMNEIILEWSLMPPTDYDGVAGTYYRYYYSDVVSGMTPCETSWVPDNGYSCSLVVTCSGDFELYFESDPDNDDDGYTVSQGDCDDNDAEEFPGQTWYTDSDGDGFGNMDDTGTISCEKPEGKVSNNDDCDDDDGAINPGAEEVCDGIDNNCDGNIDEGLEDEGCYEWCGDVEKQNKVVMCHNGKDICVSINAIDAHIAHGDSLNSCSSKSANNGKGEKAEEIPTSYDVAFWPNPSNNNFNVKLITPNVTEKVSIEAYDINGRLMHSNIINGNENYQFGNNLSTGIYIVKLTQESTTKMIKVVKQ